MVQLLASQSAFGDSIGLLHALCVGKESSKFQLDGLVPVSFLTCNNDRILKLLRA